MLKLNRRQMLQAGVAVTTPLSVLAGVSLARDDKKQNDEKEKGKSGSGRNEKATLQYLEIVTTDADALCKQYSAIHDVTFGKPEPSLGNARVAELSGGSKIAIRGPLREGEAPVIRPYMHVENIEQCVADAKKLGAKVAIEKMPIPGHGTIAIVIHGGIECGFWQS